MVGVGTYNSSVNGRVMNAGHMCFFNGVKRSAQEDFGVPAAQNLVKFCSRSWPWKNRSHIGIFAPWFLVFE
jgi:hypothetical protein